MLTSDVNIKFFQQAVVEFENSVDLWVANTNNSRTIRHPPLLVANCSVAAGDLQCAKTIKVELRVSSLLTVLSTINMPETAGFHCRREAFKSHWIRNSTSGILTSLVNSR